jgi:hypothetical protein
MSTIMDIIPADFQGSDYKEPSKTVTVTVLASDFHNNHHMNTARDLTGCPVIRALIRAGVDIEDGYCTSEVSKADMRVLRMFHGTLPVEDFSFEINL